MSDKLSTIYAFDCSVHGQEISVHCFRAFDKALSNRWAAYDISSVSQRAVSPEEYQQITKLPSITSPSCR